MTIAYYILVFIGAALIGLQVTFSRVFRARALEIADRLHEEPPTRDLPNSLPPIVADFAFRAGAESGARLRLASFKQKAELRLKPGGKFIDISAWQVIALSRAGFLWDARQEIWPISRLRVIDAFVGGAGHLEARLFGSIPLAKAEGSDINLAEAFRYLAELPWAPDAILGNPDLVWRVTGANEAEVRLDTPDGVARVTFEFDAEGDIVGMSAKDRPSRDAKGNTVKYDWRGRFSDYAQVGARRLPTYGEVGYVYPTGYETYFRGRIVEYHVTA
jgi:hypothetical protein